MFDYICCELTMPDGYELEKDCFQTKSLWRGMDRFTITAAGRLIFHERQYHYGCEKDEQGKCSPQHVAELDTNYHGDIEIHGSAGDGTSLRYAIRFTHGNVEWIRPLDSLPELHRLWLMECGR